MRLSRVQVDHVVEHIERMYPETKQQREAIRKGGDTVGNWGRIYHAEVIAILEAHVGECEG